MVESRKVGFWFGIWDLLLFWDTNQFKSPTGPGFFSPRLYVLVDAALSPDPTYVARTLVYVKVPKLTGLVSPIQTQLPPFGKKPSIG